MFTTSLLKKTLCLTIGVSTLAISSSAYADFGWKTQPVASASTQQGVVEMSSKAEEKILPNPVGQIEANPMTQDVSASIADAINTEPAAGGSNIIYRPSRMGGFIDGFGNGIPLAIALRDIVPPSYAFVFSSRDLAGMRVTWRGGKPWTGVLSDTLLAHGLEASFNASTITIFPRQYYGIRNVSYYNTPSLYNSRGYYNGIGYYHDRGYYRNYYPVLGNEYNRYYYNGYYNASLLPLIDVQRTARWATKPGYTLRETLQSWSNQVNVNLTWSTSYDYPIENAFYFTGTFDKAVESLLATYGGESPAPKGRLYHNYPEGPAVLMVN